MSNTVEANIVGRESVSDEIAKVTAALATLKDKTVKVNVEVDTDKNALLKKVNEAVGSYNDRSVGKSKIRLEVSDDDFKGKVSKAVKDAVKDSKIDVDVNVKTSEAKKDLAELKALVSALSTDDINIDVDVNGAEAAARLAEIKALIEAIDGETVNVKVDVDSSRLSQSIDDAVNDHNGKTKNRRAVVEVNKTKFSSSINDAVKFYNDDNSPRAHVNLTSRVDVDKNALQASINDAIGDETKYHRVKIHVNKNTFYDSVNEAVDGYNKGNARAGKKEILVATAADFAGAYRIGEKEYIINADVDKNRINSSLDDIFNKTRVIKVKLEFDDKATSILGDDANKKRAKKTAKPREVIQPVDIELRKRFTEDPDYWDFMEYGFQKIREYARKHPQNLEIAVRAGIIPDEDHDKTRMQRWEALFQRDKKLVEEYMAKHKDNARIMARNQFGAVPDRNWKGEDHKYFKQMEDGFAKAVIRVKQIAERSEGVIGKIDDKHFTQRLYLDYDVRQNAPIDISEHAKKFIKQNDEMLRYTVTLIQDHRIKNLRSQGAVVRDSIANTKSILNAIQNARENNQRVNIPIHVQRNLSPATAKNLQNQIRQLNQTQTVRPLINVNPVTNFSQANWNSVTKRLQRQIAALNKVQTVNQIIRVNTTVLQGSSNINNVNGFQKALGRLRNTLSSFGDAANGSGRDLNRFDRAMNVAANTSQGFSRGISNATRRIPVIGAMFGLIAGVGKAFGWMDNVGKQMAEFGAKTGGVLGKVSTLAGGLMRVGGVMGSVGTAAAAAAVGVQLLSAIGVIGTGAIAAGAVVAQAALAGIVGISSAVAGAIGAAVAAPFVYFAAQNEDVKKAYSDLGSHASNVMKEVSAPVVPALVRSAEALKGAFDQMRPSMERVAEGTAGLIDDLSGKLPAIAEKLGPAMEQAFDTGAKHLNTIADAMPGVVESFGNLMERMGSPKVMQATKTFWEGLPKWIDRAGGALEGAAGAFNNINDFMSGDQTKGFREGLKGFWQEMQGTDWKPMNDSLANAMNTFGKFMGSIDGAQLGSIVSHFADGFSKLTEAAESGRLVTVLEGMSAAFEGIASATKLTADGIGGILEFFNVGGIKDRIKAIEGIRQALDGVNKAAGGEFFKDPNFRNTSQALRDDLEKAKNLSAEQIGQLGRSVQSIELHAELVGLEDSTRMIENTRLTLNAMLEVDSAGLREQMTGLNEQIASSLHNIRPENRTPILDAQVATLKAAVEIDTSAAMSLIEGLRATISLEPSIDQGVFDSMMGAQRATVQATLEVADANVQQALAGNYTIAADIVPKLDTGSATAMMNAIRVSAEIIPQLPPDIGAGLADRIQGHLKNIQVNLTANNAAGVSDAIKAMIADINQTIELNPQLGDIPQVPPLEATITPSVTKPLGTLRELILPGLVKPEGIEGEVPGGPVEIPGLVKPEGGLEGLLDPTDAIPVVPEFKEFTLPDGQTIKVPVELTQPEGGLDLNSMLQGGGINIDGTTYKLKLEWAPVPPMPPIPDPPNKAIPMSFQLGPMPNIPDTQSEHRINVPTPSLPNIPDTNSTHTVIPNYPPPFSMPNSFSDHNVILIAPPPFDMPDSSSTHTINVVTSGTGGGDGKSRVSASRSMFAGFGSDAGTLWGAAGAGTSFNLSVQSIKDSVLRIAHEVERGLRDTYNNAARVATEAFGQGIKEGLVKQAPIVQQGTAQIAKAASEGGKEVKYEMEKITHENMGSSMVTWSSKIVRDSETASKNVEKAGGNLGKAVEQSGKETEKGAEKAKKISETAMKKLLVTNGPHPWGANSAQMEQIRQIGQHNKKVRELFNDIQSGAGRDNFDSDEAYLSAMKSRMAKLVDKTNELAGEAGEKVDFGALWSALEGDSQMSLSFSGGGAAQAALKKGQDNAKAGEESKKLSEDGAKKITEGNEAIKDAVGDTAIAPPMIDVAPNVQGLEAYAQLGAQIKAEIGGLSVEGSAQVTVPLAFQVPPLPQIPLPTFPPMDIPLQYTPPMALPPLPPLPPVVQQVVADISRAISDLGQIPKTIETQALAETNVPQASAEIQSLNNQNTSSTHTVNVEVNGDPKGGRSGRGRFAGFGSLAGITGNGFGYGATGLTTTFSLTSALESTQLVISNAVKQAVWNSWREVGKGIGASFESGLRFSPITNIVAQWWEKITGNKGGVTAPAVKANTLSVYKDGQLISKTLADGVRDGNKYIFSAMNEVTGQLETAVFTMPKAVNTKAAGSVLSKLLGSIVSIGTSGIKFKFDLADWSNVFQKQAMHMSAGYLNEFGQFIVYNVNNTTTVENRFDGGLVGDPERQAKAVLDVLSESRAAQGRLNEMVGSRGATV